MLTRKLKINVVKSKGFSLIEILITLVIVSIGLFGVASVQLNSIRYEHQARVRYLAQSQINDMVERMQANLTGVNSGAYNSLSGKPGVPGCASSTSGCTPAEMAIYDAATWNAINAQILPGGAGTVQSNGAGVFTITMSWNEMEPGSTGQTTKNFASTVKVE